jgi:hypothetical protein
VYSWQGRLALVGHFERARPPLHMPREARGASGGEGAKEKARCPVEWQLALTGSSMAVHETLPLMYVDVNFVLALPLAGFQPQFRSECFVS